MLERNLKIKLFKIREIHFINEKINFDEENKCDFLKVYNSTYKFHNALSKNYTVLIDLTKEIEEIFSDFKSNYRNEIKKSIKDDEINFRIFKVDSINDIKSFLNRHQNFVNYKKHNFNLGYIKKQLIDFKDSIYISQAIKNNNIINENLYLFDENIARFKLGTSNRFKNVYDSKIYSRVNKYLHYRTIEFFKEKGLKIYDFGGISYKESIENINIRKFKQGFSKNSTKIYEGNIPISNIAKISLTLYDFFKKSNKKNIKR